MTQLADLKGELLEVFHRELREPAIEIAASRATREEKAKTINTLVGATRRRLSQEVTTLEVADRPNYALVLQYCFSVASLEYRHKVWPYEYMAFSRRIG